MQHYHLLGTKITSATTDELHDLIARALQDGRRIHIGSGNIHSFNTAYVNPTMRGFLNRAEAVRCDGYGVVLGARLLGATLAGRITWADWWDPLGAFCESHDISMFFLGAKPGVAEAAQRKIQARFARLRIVGVHDGYFQKEGPESDAVVAAVNEARPDILVVGMGMPLQETWLDRHREKLDVPVVLTGGACFDYLSETIPRCPAWMSRGGLEWLYRLLLEPRRMFRRYIIGNPLFFIRLFLSLFKGNASGGFNSQGV